MTRNQLTDLIINHKSRFEEETNFKKRFIDLLLEPNCFMRLRLEGHFTASCWTTDMSRRKVLLMHHAKLNKWLQPGGHADGDENLINVAKKELQEETGLENYSTSNFNNIFDIDIHTIPEKKGIPEHFHYDVRFHFIADKPDEIKKNHESNDLKWVNLDDVQEICKNEKSIMRMVEKTIQMNQIIKTT